MPTTTPRHRRRRTALAAATTLVLGAACSSGSDDGRSDTGSVDDDAATSAEGAGSPVGVPNEPLAIVEGEAGMLETLEILDLRRAGDTITLEFVVVPGDRIGRNGDDLLSPTDTLSHGHAVSGVTVVDHDNRKRHLVLRDSDGVCLCSRFRAIELTPGTRYRHSAQFAAPPDGVDAMTVEVPAFPAVDGVPLRTVG